MTTLTLIQQLEQSLLDHSVRQSPEQVNKLIADDFVEFGSSGQVYHKQNCIKPDENPRKFVVSDFKVKELSKDVMLATYKTTEDGAAALRSSVWRRHDDAWQMIFHQGTKCEVDESNPTPESIPNTTYKLYKNLKDTFKIIDAKLFAYNKTCVPATQTPEAIDINYVIKENDLIIAGICADVYIWKIMYLELLFVDEEHRNKDLATILLQRVEQEAKAMGAALAHTDTYDFQAKDFYLKQGYEIFGVLDDCPHQHKRYYLKKVL